VGVRVEGDQKLVELRSDDSTTTVAVDEILIGVGQNPNVEALNLEAAGVKYDVKSGIKVNDFLQTTNKRIYARVMSALSICSPISKMRPRAS